MIHDILIHDAMSAQIYNVHSKVEHKNVKMHKILQYMVNNTHAFNTKDDFIRF